ncbi:MAG TPA: hypothetical protein P5105_04740, partial [Victivallales bacterium]|nr:hypothetical protein [Victivallales bacterium]
MKLKFSAADWAYYEKSGLSPEEYYNKLVELGYTGVEMVPQERLKIAKSAGLEILNESIFADCIPHGLNRKENQDKMVDAIYEA